MADHSRLGRGLAALIGDVGDETSVADSGRKPRRAPIENLSPNPRNPRRLFTDTELDELSDSIRERGIIQPVSVRPFDILGNIIPNPRTGATEIDPALSALAGTIAAADGTALRFARWAAPAGGRGS